MTHVAVLPDLIPASYRPHELHGENLVWVEKNCYVDLWIELLHAQGLEPRACLPFVLAIDFEGDQWTFFKPPLADLRTLYGIDVQELNLWRPLLDHALEHLGAGKWVSVEVDAFWLPDTSATDYRQAHSKTTIVLNEIDTAAARLGYFHNAGYFELAGDDYAGIFAAPAAPDALPPYAELIRIDRAASRDMETLRSLSENLLMQHLQWRPTSNPLLRFRERFDADIAAMQQAGLAHYHRWAFAGIRQLGAAFELAAVYLRWAGQNEEPTESIQAFERIAENSKALILKTARAVNSGRASGVHSLLEAMAGDWDEAMRQLG